MSTPDAPTVTIPEKPAFVIIEKGKRDQFTADAYLVRTLLRGHAVEIDTLLHTGEAEVNGTLIRLVTAENIIAVLTDSALRPATVITEHRERDVGGNCYSPENLALHEAIDSAGASHIDIMGVARSGNAELTKDIYNNPAVRVIEINEWIDDKGTLCVVKGALVTSSTLATLRSLINGENLGSESCE